jgi:histidinol-phosphate/aromatic aminotransferase/cobyric acid decarboxylase-like protein
VTAAPSARFPLADWIDAHPECRYDLATSGMVGAIPPPPWPRRRPAPDVPERLREQLAEHLGVAPDRVFLAHGASEANAWVLGYLAREASRGGRAPTVRVAYPEYPPLFDAARAFGCELRSGRGPVEVAAVSRPRNPEGDLWSEERVLRYADGARHLVVDETFREFADAGSMAARGAPRLWATGSFTKFYGADAARVGFVVAPPDVPARFVRHVGLVSNKLAPGSAAIALGLLRRHASVRREVRAVVDRNRRALGAAFPGAALPVAPVFLDRLSCTNGTDLAQRCLTASVLVSPGRFFGAPRGVRVCLTRRTFPAGLGAYLRVRARAEGRPSPGAARVRPLHRASR